MMDRCALGSARAKMLHKSSCRKSTSEKPKRGHCPAKQDFVVGFEIKY